MTTNNVQTTYGADPAIAYAGQLANAGPHRINTVIVEAAIAAGLVVLRGATTRAEGRPPPAPDAADPDGIVATGASAATAQALSGASLDGVVGGGEMTPPRPVTLVLSSHANWDLTTARIYGTDEDGLPIEEALVIPDAGNATVTTSKAFHTVTSVYIPAQAGTAGTFTVGFSAGLGPIGARQVHGVSLYDASRKPEAFQVDEAMPVLRDGQIYAYAEAAVDVGDPVYVRFVSTGDEVNGSMRATADANDCALLKGARWASKTTGAGFAVVELNLP